MPHQLIYWVCGRSNRFAIPLEWEASDTIENVKAEASRSFGRPVARLTFAGQELQNGRTLADYNIQPGDTIDATFKRSSLTSSA